MLLQPYHLAIHDESNKMDLYDSQLNLERTFDVNGSIRFSKCANGKLLVGSIVRCVEIFDINDTNAKENVYIRSKELIFKDEIVVFENGHLGMPFSYGEFHVYNTNGELKWKFVVDPPDGNITDVFRVSQNHVLFFVSNNYIDNGHRFTGFKILNVNEERCTFQYTDTPRIWPISMTVLPDGRFAYIQHLVFHLWNVHTHEHTQIRFATSPSGALKSKFVKLKDERLAISWDDKGLIRLFDVHEKQYEDLRISIEITKLFILPSGELGICSIDSISIWDFEKNCLRPIVCLEMPDYAPSFHQDLIAFSDNSILIKNGETNADLNFDNGSNCRHIQELPDGKIVFQIDLNEEFGDDLFKRHGYFRHIIIWEPYTGKYFRFKSEHYCVCFTQEDQKKFKRNLFEVLIPYLIVDLHSIVANYIA